MTITYEPTTSTRETIVEDLWRAGWFLKTARGIVRSTPTLDAHDVATEAVFTATVAARTWDIEKGEPLDMWVKFRARGAMIHEYRKHMKYVSGLIDLDPTQPFLQDGDITLMDVKHKAPSAEDETFTRVFAAARADIEDAIRDLTYPQQVVTRGRMMAGRQREPGRYAARGNWIGARQKLKVRLSHLKWMVREARG